MKLNLPPGEYYAQLTKVPTSSGVLFRNSKNEFLIVKPSYKDYWEIPGGMGEINENARLTAIREVKEELDLDVKNLSLFCIDFATDKPFARVLFLFDGGILSDTDIKNIKIDSDEIGEYGFFTFEKIIMLVGEKLKNRLINSSKYFTDKEIIYLENGEVVKTIDSGVRNNYAFIDSQNVHLSIIDLGWKLNFGRFRKYLTDKYKISKAFIFIGYLENNQDLYRNLEKSGFTCIFKPTLEYKDGTTKGNCDSELVLQAMIESKNYDKAIIVTGDGDFNCLAKYLIRENKLGAILIPNKFKFSALLKFKEFRPFLRYMNDLEKKLAYTRKGPLRTEP